MALGVTTPGDGAYLLAYDNGDAFLYDLFDGSLNGAIEAGEVALIGVFRGVAVGSIPSASITMGT